MTLSPGSGRSLEDLESAVERLLAAYRQEKARARELAIQVAELEARLARAPAALDALQDENRRLRRNAAVAAARIEEILERL